MGLDMYLDKHIYLGWDHEHNRQGVEIPDLSKYGINSSRVTYVVESAIYWRKANAIHAWFVRNVQDGEDDCKDYYVSIINLRALYDDVCKVLESTDLAEEILPTQRGFFFGSTEYDEYYWEDISYTKKELERVFNNHKSRDDYNYHSSW